MIPVLMVLMVREHDPHAGGTFVARCACPGFPVCLSHDGASAGGSAASVRRIWSAAFVLTCRDELLRPAAITRYEPEEARPARNYAWAVLHS